MPDQQIVNAYESDLAAAKKPFYARRDKIESDYAEQLYYGSHDGSIDAVKRLAEERNEKLRQLAAEFAPVFNLIADWYGMEVRHG
jgi:hypothetical protein